MKKKPAKKQTTISSLTKKIQKHVKPAVTSIRKLDRKSRWYLAGLVLAGVLLLVTSVYGGYHASNDYSTNSNAVIGTQLFSGDVSYPVILPGPHATLIIVPLLYIQGHLPYHYTSFTLVNIGLVVVTMFAWAFLLIKLFGRKYEVPILVLLSSLIFTAVAFSLSLAYTTIRNIEYPIVLWFVMIIAYLLKGASYSRKQLLFAITGTILFIITLAGDSFFTYAILLPLGLVLVWYWIQSQRFTINMVKALALMAGTYVGAVVLKFILGATGIIYFDYGFGTKTSSYQPPAYGNHWDNLTQTLELHGANLFGQVIDIKNLGLFINFALLLVGLVSLGLILGQTNRNYRKKLGLTEDKDFVLAVMAVSFIVIFVIYATSGYAIATLPNGQIVDAKNARYISLLPLITTIGLIWLLKTYYKNILCYSAYFVHSLVGSIVTSYPRVRNDYASSAKQLELAPSRASIDQIRDILKQNNVTAIATDYWYGPVLRFWTSDGVELAPQVGCDAKALANPSNGNFTKMAGRNSALIVDRGVQNYGFWQCTDEQLTGLYGAPNKVLEVQGAGPNPPVQIWIYKDPANNQ